MPKLNNCHVYDPEIPSINLFFVIGSFFKTVVLLRKIRDALLVK